MRLSQQEKIDLKTWNIQKIPRQRCCDYSVYLKTDSDHIFPTLSLISDMTTKRTPIS